MKPSTPPATVATKPAHPPRWRRLVRWLLQPEEVYWRDCALAAEEEVRVLRAHVREIEADLRILRGIRSPRLEA